MKKIITSVSLVALGAASVQAAYAPGLSSGQSAKPWSVSATLRGFYDDNYVTLWRDKKRESFGFEVSPSFALSLTRDQTSYGLNYTYGMKFYEDRSNSRADHSHQANARLSHAFTPRYKLDVSDSFVVAQEPEILAPPGMATVTAGSPLRTLGNNIRNTASVTLGAWLMPDDLQAVAGYSNNMFDFEQTGPLSKSAFLDRVEHLLSLNMRWTLVPETVGVLGYQYGIVDYTSKDLLANAHTPDERDNTSHYVFVGADHQFTKQLNALARVGFQFTEYDNVNRDSINPYAEGNVTWTYNPGSSINLGVRHSRTQTDVSDSSIAAGATPTLDAETTAAFASLNHKIASKLNGSILGQYSHSAFELGKADKLGEDMLLVGVNLSYEINKFLSAEAGYNFDRLDSDIDQRSFTRNRVYVGIRGSY